MRRLLALCLCAYSTYLFSRYSQNIDLDTCVQKRCSTFVYLSGLCCIYLLKYLNLFLTVGYFKWPSDSFMFVLQPPIAQC